MLARKNSSIWTKIAESFSLSGKPITFEIKQPQTVRLAGNTIKVVGSLKGSNYLDLIEKGREATYAGMEQLTVDLAQTDQITNTGLFALYSVIKLFRGEEPPVYTDGFSALAQMKQDMQVKVWHNLREVVPD